MSIFLKAGSWLSKKQGFNGEFNLTYLIQQMISGGGGISGTTNKVAKFTDPSTIGDSQIEDNGTNVGIGVAPSGTDKLKVAGTISASAAVNPDQVMVKSQVTLQTITTDTNRNLAYGRNFQGTRSGQNVTAAHCNFFGESAGANTNTTTYCNFLGFEAGELATEAGYSNFLGFSAGRLAVNAQYSNFLGFSAGQNATAANYSNFFGNNAGKNSPNANNSNFFGTNAGSTADNASTSNFFGTSAGQSATNASNSNFIGWQAGQSASNASYCNFIGYRAGKQAPSSVGTNNIIIGTNISLFTGTTNRINLGGVIFASNTHSDIFTNPPSIVATPTGRVQIGTDIDNGVDRMQINGSTLASQYKLSVLNTAPVSATDIGTLGEIRYVSDYIYVCIATNTWVRSPLTTW